MYDTTDERETEVPEMSGTEAAEGQLLRRSRSEAAAERKKGRRKRSERSDRVPETKAAEEAPSASAEPANANAEFGAAAEPSERARLEPAPVFQSLFWSLAVSLFSVANPLLTAFASNLQSQNLYAGWVMSQGQLPYVGFYGSGGLLYYFLLWLGSLAFGQLLLIAFQAAALWLAGIYLYKVVAASTLKSSLGRAVLPLFYLLVFALGFGGLYASLFAFPFIFGSLYFIVKYMRDEARDEAFLLYGGIAALAFMTEPAYSVIFYSIAGLVLLVCNTIEKRKARGLYQFLAALVGFSLVFYPLGYITVWNGSFGQAINQVTYLFTAFDLTGSHLLSNLLFYGLLLLGLGFLSALVMAVTAKIEQGSARVLQVIGFLGLLAVAVTALALPEQGAYQLLPLLPYAMILFALWFGKETRPSGKHRRERRKISLWTAYIARQFFLPLLALLYLLAFPFVQEYILSSGASSSRAAAAAYIRDNSEREDMVYAWDSSAALYQASQRASASPILSPTLYMGNSENQLALRNNLNTGNPKFILVKNDVPQTEELQSMLAQNYKEVKLSLRGFKLYERN